MNEFEEIAHQVNKLVRDGGQKQAYLDLAQKSLSGLLKLFLPSKCQYEIKFLGHATLGLASPAHLRIEFEADRRVLYCSEELVTDSFTNRLDSFITIKTLLEADPATALSKGSLIFDIEDASNLGTYRRAAFGSSLDVAELVTDSYWIKYQGYVELRQSISDRFIPWRERKNVCFWRGSTTGLRAGTPGTGKRVDDWHWLQRLLLCDTAKKSSLANRLDVGVVNFVQIPEKHLQEAITAAGFLMPRSSKMEFLEYRYLIDIDGNANAWDGFFTALLMGACILKVDSRAGWREWYYSRLRPWEHYIPVAADLSDLTSKLDWALSNEVSSSKMSTNAREFALGLDYVRELNDSSLRLASIIRSANRTS